MTTDIKVGDLIRATSKYEPELVIQGRVKAENPKAYSINGRITFRDMYDFEVLDRPLPKVEDDLLDKVIAIHLKTKGYEGPLGEVDKEFYTRELTPLINAVREYDRSKESK